MAWLNIHATLQGLRAAVEKNPQRFKTSLLEDRCGMELTTASYAAPIRSTCYD